MVRKSEKSVCYNGSFQIEEITLTDKPDMRVETRQSKLQANAEAIERWQRKLFRASNELQRLVAQRKRLLGPKRPTEVRYRSLDEIRMACGGTEFNDELPG
jgi:hypothetical protein